MNAEHTQRETKLPLLVGSLKSAISSLRTAEECAKEVDLGQLQAQINGAVTNLEYALIQANDAAEQEKNRD